MFSWFLFFEDSWEKTTFLACTRACSIGCSVRETVFSQLGTWSSESLVWGYHMNIMSFNCRGLANPSKKLSLWPLIEFNLPDVVLLQETLGLNEDVSCILESLLMRWKFVVADVHGHFGGLASGWNLKSHRCDGM